MRGALDLALAWTLLGAFGVLSRGRRGPTRSLLLAALRRAARSSARHAPGAVTVSPDLLVAFRRASGAQRIVRSCVPRALALHRLLALHGLPARVRLGLDPSRRPPVGHAWVECGGVPVGEAPSDLARYRPCETS